MNAIAFLHRQSRKPNRYWIIPPANSRHPQEHSRQWQTKSSSYLRSLVKAKVKQGDYSGAIAILTQLIKRHPHSAADYNNRGLIHFQNGQLDLAIADYNKALELNTRLDSAYNNRANYYASLGMWKEALADYDMALDFNPANTRAWINQGITFRQLGLHERALDNFDFALLFGQLTGQIYAERGRTYHLRGDWNCAIADYKRAITHLPTSSDSHGRQKRIESWIDELLKHCA
jgi:tetratricopeptide (TPR) repeat protein